MSDVALWDGLADLISYPMDNPKDRLAACIETSRQCHPANPDVTAALERFGAQTAGLSLIDLQEHYTGTFDFDPACTLDLGWHLHGESYERGAFMASLVEDLARACVPESAELPDHLTNVLALIGREGVTTAATRATVIQPAIERVRRALAERRSPYAAVLEAIEAQMWALTSRTAPAKR